MSERIEQSIGTAGVRMVSELPAVFMSISCELVIFRNPGNLPSLSKHIT